MHTRSHSTPARDKRSAEHSPDAQRTTPQTPFAAQHLPAGLAVRGCSCLLSRRPLADCLPSQRTPPPFELGSHHPGVHHAAQEGLLTAPTLDGHARQLGIDVATAGIVYKLDGNEYSFPADEDTFIQLPVTISV
jgi:hypothetical protein